jgi:Ca2+-binding EF-hand superfamily protein
MIALLIVLLGTVGQIQERDRAAKASQTERGWGSGVDILFPSDEKLARLRIAVTVEARAPDAEWEAFLNKLFDYFDRDGNGFLSAAEAERIFALPLPDGREAKMNFATLDTDRDGQGSRAEFRAFYQASGFTPVVGIIRPTRGDKADPKRSEHDRLGSALFQHLDHDRSGKLTRAKLEKATGLLRRLDENEDELLTPAELLAVGTTGSVEKEGSALRLAVAAANQAPAAVLHLAVAKRVISAKLESAGELFRARDTGAGALTFDVPGGRATVATVGESPERFLTAKAFYLAQFNAAIGTRAALGKAELEADASLQALAAMFDAADRNGDGKLTVAELQTFLEIVELGVSCQVVVAIEDRGRNLFDLLDTNQDGVLDLAELKQAARICAEVGALPLTPSIIPRQFQFSVVRGNVSANFGPVSLPTAARPKAPIKTIMTAGGPKWFQAMDRNGDGFISEAEFIGPPELFRKLDVNQDGRISVEEALGARP